MNQQPALDAVATHAFELLSHHEQVLVTAESCTAGYIAATLSRVPGMSRCLAGAVVVYQSASKTAWLDVSADLIERFDAVSREVAEAMALQALKKTPHATIAISITGHLGPDAPAELDGVAWLGWADRRGLVEAQRLTLQSDEADENEQRTRIPARQDVRATEVDRRVIIRHERQMDAVCQSLGFLCDRLAEMG